MAVAPKRTADHWSTDLFGPKLLTKPHTSGVPTAAALRGKKLVALYFSASWCPPCRSFSPTLIEFYKSVRDDVEIIFVSSDRDDASFSDYFGKFPWLAMVPGHTSKEHNDRQATLATKMHIQGIPSVVVLDADTGHFVTDGARDDIMGAAGEEARRALVQSWLAREAVPLDRAAFGGDVAPATRAFRYVLSRPMLLFGVMYGVNQGLRYLAGLVMGKGAIEEEQQEL